MSAEEEDTFDIDIYGDQDPQAPATEYDELQQQEIDYDEPNGADHGYDGAYEEGDGEHSRHSAAPAKHPVDSTTETGVTHIGAESPQTSSPPPSREPQPQQGTKRKAPSEEEAEEEVFSSNALHQTINDPTATPALKLTDLNWWTTEETLRGFCARAGPEVEKSSLLDLSFSEHKINGKSRGEAYLEFRDPVSAAKVKAEIEKANSASAEKALPGKKMVLGCYFTAVGNPFKTGPMNSAGGGGGGGAGKGIGVGGGRGGRDGAYERGYGSQRGNYGGRGGGFGQSRGGGGGGGGYGNGMYNNRSNQQQQPMQPMQPAGWNASGSGMMNGGGMGGFASNPMMSMFNNMARGGGMMQNMMGRGGYGGMGNMGMGMGMNPRGGGGGMLGGMNMGMQMMGRGGWGGGGGYQGGMQQGYGGNGFQGGGSGMQQQMQSQQQQGNKRAKME